MRNSIKKFERSIIFLLKILMFGCLFLVFFGLFAIPNHSLRVVSRTSAITMLSFVVLGISLMSVYGGYAIGKQKSKPIMQSLILATVITDLITYLQLCIMNTNVNKYSRLTFADWDVLILVVIVQAFIIYAFVYLGNFFYFKVNPPENVCVITSSQYSVDKVVRVIKKYKKQYKITSAIDYRSKKVYDTILKNKTVFIYDVPVQERTHIIEFCYQNEKSVYFNPEINDVVALGSKHTMLDDKSFISWSKKELSLEQRFAKRLMDIVISFIGLVITSPVMFICAIAIKLNDHGKIIFKQKRATIHGRVFSVYKFRTMNENVANASATENDERITKVGGFLRKTRLDELPQLINILKGDMSIVGPRPEMIENVCMYTEALPEFEYRLRVKAGLTGLAQIAGKYNTSPKDKLVLDLLYIEKYSVLKDIKLMVQTLTVFFKKDSAEGFDKSPTETVLMIKSQDMD